MFNVEANVNHMTNWMRDWFEKNGKGCNMVIGISGGKDSAVVAAIGVRALGISRVKGILLPCGIQPDIKDSMRIVECLGIEGQIVNIQPAVEAVLKSIPKSIPITKQTIENLSPRIRMSTLYAISQSINGRVPCNCNYSEDYIGYSTVYGDDAGDLRPLAEYTATEVLDMIEYLGLPNWLHEKAPADGLCGRTDEENIGFTYAVLDNWLRNGIEPEKQVLDKILAMHKRNAFKLEPRKVCPYLAA